MPSLPNFPVAKQEGKNSCWACAARMINNFFVGIGRSGSNKKFDSDTDLAKAIGKSIDNQESAADALFLLKYENGADKKPIPTKKEINKAISNNQPLLAIIGSNNPHGKRNLKARNGHWLVIVGIEDSNIAVFDPDSGKIKYVDLSDNYEESAFWQNTSYVDPQ